MFNATHSKSQNSNDWKKAFGFSEFSHPELYESIEQIRPSLYSSEIKKVMINFSVEGIFCIQEVPQIVILRQNNFDAEEILKLYKALWNQSFASVLAVVSKKVIHIYSLAGVSNEFDSEKYLESCRINNFKVGIRALELEELVYGANSGRLWEDKSNFFNPNERIDNVLLENLTAANEIIISEGLNSIQTQSLLLQTMFIAYLEDREILNKNYIENATKLSCSSLSDIFDSCNVENLNLLFSQLQKNFNGDLFVTPCSFDKLKKTIKLTNKTMNTLKIFREGLRNIESNQGRLFGYDFKYIPISLISAVYNRFLNHDKDVQKNSGAYFTPLILVDTTINSIWSGIDDQSKKNGRFFDPSCGSGLFLVRCFQRLLEHEMSNNQVVSISWEKIVNKVNQIVGCDVNGMAVRVAVFSIYIAMLEFYPMKDVEKFRVEEISKLPKIWKKNLIKRDFFNFSPKKNKFDIIVGNPPWKAQTDRESLGLEWCKKNGIKSSNGELAFAFLFKSIQHAKENGTVALLAPAQGLLHNQSKSAIETREFLFENNQITKIINFSDFRNQLFDNAKNAVALLVIKKTRRTELYKFDYFVPKVEMNYKQRHTFNIRPSDQMELKLSDVVKNPSIFKQRFWMNDPEVKLFSYLDRMPKLSECVIEYKDVVKNVDNFDKMWIIGRGVGLKNHDDEIKSRDKKKLKIKEYRHITGKDMTPIKLIDSKLFDYRKEIKPRRSGLDFAFSKQKILVKKMINVKPYRLVAALAGDKISFLDNIYGITFPTREYEHAKFITGVLNSKLMAWYTFHSISSFGTIMNRILQHELINLPFPSAEFFIQRNVEKSILIQKKLVNVVNDYLELESSELSAENYYSNDYSKSLLEKIDQLTYEYFDLTDSEVTLIEDTIRYKTPAIAPNPSSFPLYWNACQYKDRELYAQTLGAEISSWLKSNNNISIELVGFNNIYGALRISILIPPQEFVYKEYKEHSFTKILSELISKENKEVKNIFKFAPDFRMFEGSNLYLIKPMQLRYWTRSSAIDDASRIFVDIQKLILETL